MPSWEEDLQSLHKCKTHLQNHWSPLFVVFCKLSNAKLIWRGPWRCSYKLQVCNTAPAASRQREILAKGPRLPVTTDSSQGAAAWYSSSRREGGVVAGLTAAILQRRRTTVAVLERCRCLYLVRRQSYVSPNIVEFFWKMTWRGGGVVCRRYQQSRTRLIVEFSSSAVTCRPRDAGAGRRR